MKKSELKALIKEVIKEGIKDGTKISDKKFPTVQATVRNYKKKPFQSNWNVSNTDDAAEDGDDLHQDNDRIKEDVPVNKYQFTVSDETRLYINNKMRHMGRNSDNIKNAAYRVIDKIIDIVEKSSIPDDEQLTIKMEAGFWRAFVDYEMR